MKSTRYKETEDQMSIKNYGGSNHKTEYDYDEKKWWDEIQTSNSHKQWTPKLKETSSPYATMCTPRLGVMMMMMMMMMMWWDEMQTYNKSIKSDNLQLIYKIIHTTYKKSIKTYNPLQEIYNPSLQVVYPPYFESSSSSPLRNPNKCLFMSISSEKGSSIPFWSPHSSGPEDNKRRWRPSRLPGVLNGYETQ